MIKREMKYGTKLIPHISRLPKGVRFVKQDGHELKTGIKKYSAFLASGRCVLIPAGNSIKEARKRTLDQLNSDLFYERMLFEKALPLSHYKSIIN